MTDPRLAKMRESLINQLSCIVVAGAYCHTDEGWEGFKKYLACLSSMMPESRPVSESDRDDINSAVFIVKSLIQSPQLLDLIIREAVKEQSRTYNLYGPDDVNWEGEEKKDGRRKQHDCCGRRAARGVRGAV